MPCKPLTLAIAGALLLSATVHAQPERAAPVGAVGTWINPRRTVEVRTGNCAGSLCGWVVWAAPSALADARDGGDPHLLGTELLRDYHDSRPGRYVGEVYVPDMGRSFASTIEQRDADTLRISGCILGGRICKSQTWHRI